VNRRLVVASAQMGPVALSEPRSSVVDRLLDLLREAASRRAELVVFPEATLTPFFPHWLVSDDKELDSYFEDEMPGPSVKPLFDEAARLGVGFYLGYGERVVESDGKVCRFNSSVLVERDGTVIGTYRKVHLPGYHDTHDDHPFQNLEKRYFDVGDLGFPVWDAFGGRVGMCICNDRRWPETYRVMGLQGVELVLLGYNTPVHNPAMAHTDGLVDFHNRLSMQAGAYQNATWVIGTAKAGLEEGVMQIGGSCIIAPSGEIVARATTVADEVITAAIDLDHCNSYKQSLFNFADHRRPEHYSAITQLNP
jgi:N-carbamoyl-D-amino-acid hydrolase